MTGAELKKIRTELRLSVTDVSRMTGICRVSIYNVEKGAGPERYYLFLELFYDQYRYKEMTRLKKEFRDQ